MIFVWPCYLSIRQYATRDPRGFFQIIARHLSSTKHSEPLKSFHICRNWLIPMIHRPNFYSPSLAQMRKELPAKRRNFHAHLGHRTAVGKNAEMRKPGEEVEIKK